jgi:hypothetical protein
MSVYFVYRSPYAGPSGKHIRCFPDASVLDWFRRVWVATTALNETSELDAHGWLKAELGTSAYGLSSLFENAQDKNLPPPETAAQLEEYIKAELSSEGPKLFSEHAIRVKTDDDDLDLAYFFFDDHYLKEKPQRARYLLYEDWALPTENGKGGFTPNRTIRPLEPAAHGEGAVYIVILSYYDSGCLDLPGPRIVPGVRLPGFADYLRRSRPTPRSESEPGFWVQRWPFELTLLRASLPKTGPDLSGALARCNQFPFFQVGGGSSELGVGSFLEAKAEYKALKEKILAKNPDARHGDPKKSLFRTEEHLAQAALHVGLWPGAGNFHQWYFFDDIWASAHPTLANAFLDYASRWDVLE